MYTASAPSGQTPTDFTTGLSEDYREIVANSGVNVFFGIILNNNQATKVYSCAVESGTPFCLESSDAAYNTNKDTLIGVYGEYDSELAKGCYDSTNLGGFRNCSGISTQAQANANGFVTTSENGLFCDANRNVFSCNYD